MDTNSKRNRRAVFTLQGARRIVVALLVAGVICAGCKRHKPGPPGLTPPPAGAVSSPGQPSCLTTDYCMLAITHTNEVTDVWCAAASAQMIMQYLGTNVEQCAQAQAALPPALQNTIDCCGQPLPAACLLVDHWPDFPAFGFQCTVEKHTPLTWDQIRVEVGCSNRPFAHAYRWRHSQNGHMVVVNGYQTSNSVQQLLINDPLWADQNDVTCRKVMDFEVYAHGTNDSVWWRDYYQIRRQDVNPPGLEPLPPPPATATSAAPMQTRAFVLAAAPAALSPDLVAVNALQTYAGTLSPGFATAIGFENPEVIRHGIPEPPLAVSFVGADELSHFQPADDPQRVLEELGRKLYPVRFGEQVRTLLTVERVAGVWRTASLGEGIAGRLWSDARQRSMAASHVPLAKHFAVEVPSLNAYFVAYGRGRELMLTPIADNQALGLVRGQSEAATAVFGRLAPAAAAIREGVR